MPTPIGYIYDSTGCTLSTKGQSTPMPCVYTRWVDAHRCLPLSVYIEFTRFLLVQKNTLANVFNFKILPNYRLTPASHCQQSIIRRYKSNKKNWDLQKNQRLSCKSQSIFFRIESYPTQNVLFTLLFLSNPTIVLSLPFLRFYKMA